jgi:hypothetical protein
LFSGFGERLAGKPSAKNVVCRHVSLSNRSYVTLWQQPEVPFIEKTEVFVDIAGENTIAPKRLQRQMKAAETAKQIDKSHATLKTSCHRWRPDVRLKL